MRLRKYHLFPMLLSLCVSALCCFVTGAGASPVPVLPGTPAGIISTPGDYGTEQEDTNATPGSYPETETGAEADYGIEAEEEAETGEEMALEEQEVPDDLISDLPLTLLKAPILKATPDVLTYESLTASAAMTGTNSFKITLEVRNQGTRFYGFDLGRNGSVDQDHWHLSDPDVTISIPHNTNGISGPRIKTVKLGSVTIDSTNITKSRYESRQLKITWTISGAQQAAAFAGGLSGNTLYLNIGGKYKLSSNGDYDACINNGPITVTNLAACVKQASCTHGTKKYTYLNDSQHSVTCSSCGYSFGNEAHNKVNGKCSGCGHSFSVSGTLKYVLNGRTVTETYNGVPGSKYTPKSFPGYITPAAVTIPAAGGTVTVNYEPIRYTIVTEEENYTLKYDESLFFPGKKRKGYTLNGYTVQSVS